jgi:methionyl-tRNA synthetase
VESFVSAVNAYISEQAPWKVARDEAARDRLATILYTAAEALRAVAVLHHPVMPKATAQLWAALGADAIGPLAGQVVSESARWGQLPAGVRMTKGPALFPRLPDDDPT